MKYKKMNIKKIYLNKKGFTLVELIATIVILGAIALITTPIVLNTIKRAKNESYMRSCEQIEKGAEAYVNSELGGIVENDMIISSDKLVPYVSNLSSKEDYVLVKELSDGTTKYYYTGREKNPNDKLVSLKNTIEKSQIIRNTKINGVTVNKVYGTYGLKNYVWFSGHLWQVLETNNVDGTIKLVTADPVTTISYGETNDWGSSWARKWLYNEFYENLDRKDLIEDTLFCMDKVDSYPSSYTKIESCNNTIKEKIGLLSYEDYIYATDGKNIINSSSFLEENGSKETWLITSPTTSNLQWRTVTSGIVIETVPPEGVSDWNYVNSLGRGIRPVISIKDSVLIKSGKGTKSDPYVLSSELIADVNSFISSAKIGNYVYLDESKNPYESTINEMVIKGVTENVSTSKVRYRIVKINEDGSVKLVRASVLTNLPSNIAHDGRYIPYTNIYQDYVYFTTSNLNNNFSLSDTNGNLGSYLNTATNSFYNWYSNKTKEMIQLTTWNLFTSGARKDYSNLNNKPKASYPDRTNDGTVIAYVGLPISGEMFTAADTGSGYWLLNRHPGMNFMADISGGMENAVYSTYDRLAVRPVVVLKPETYITGGEGTITEPYTLEIKVEAEKEPETENLICQLEIGTSKTTSAQYTCTLDEDRTFYVLGENESDSNKIDLIMDQNYIDDTVPKTMAWCASGTSNSCNHDNLDPYIEHIQGEFGNSVTVSLPTYDQIYKAAGNKSSGLPLWLYDNLYTSTNTSLPSGYWTSTVSSSYSNHARHVFSNGSLGNYSVNAYNSGLRPVITISKSSMN